MGIPCQMQMAENAGEAVEALGVWDQPGWAKLPHRAQVSPVGSTLPLYRVSGCTVPQAISWCCPSLAMLWLGQQK